MNCKITYPGRLEKEMKLLVNLRLYKIYYVGFN